MTVDAANNFAAVGAAWSSAINDEDTGRRSGVLQQPRSDRYDHRTVERFACLLAGFLDCQDNSCEH